VPSESCCHLIGPALGLPPATAKCQRACCIPAKPAQAWNPLIASTRIDQPAPWSATDRADPSPLPPVPLSTWCVVVDHHPERLLSLVRFARHPSDEKATETRSPKRQPTQSAEPEQQAPPLRPACSTCRFFQPFLTSRYLSIFFESHRPVQAGTAHHTHAPTHYHHICALGICLIFPTHPTSPPHSPFDISSRSLITYKLLATPTHFPLSPSRVEHLNVDLQHIHTTHLPWILYQV
jgi:hypothetical protein